MGLHYISEDSTELHFHCHNPECTYHNCANWGSNIQCTHCDSLEYVTIPASEMREALKNQLPEEELANVGDTIVTRISQNGRKQGETRKIAVDHPGIEWTGKDMVGLPVCECGSRLFLKVHFTEAELNAPNLKTPIRNPDNPNDITGFDIHPMPARHMQLAAKLKELGNVYQPKQEQS